MIVKDVKLKQEIDKKVYLGIKSEDNSNIIATSIKDLEDKTIVKDVDVNVNESVKKSFGKDYQVFLLITKIQLDERFDFKIDNQIVSYIPSKMLAYGKIEVMGVEIQGAYDSTSSRVLALGKIDTDDIEDDNIQEILESVNIMGLEGYLGCDIKGQDNSKFMFITLEQTQNVEKIERLYGKHKSIDKDNKEAKRNSAKRILNLVNNLMQGDDYKVNKEKLKIDGKLLNVVKQEMEKEIGKDMESNIFQTLGIKFKKASVLYYSGADLKVEYKGLLSDMTKELNNLSSILLDENSKKAIPKLNEEEVKEEVKK